MNTPPRTESHPLLLSGKQVTINHGTYSATVATVGASLRTLTHEGRALVTPFPADSIRPSFHGGVLVPWPNRLADGIYTDGSTTHRVPVTEPDRNNALHGLSCWVDWQVSEISAASATLSTTIAPQPGYPHAVAVFATFSLSDNGLEWVVDAHNVGDTTAPYGVGIHPYLQPQTDSPLDQWTITIPANRVLETTPDRLLPIRLHPVQEFENGIYDFRTARPIGSTRMDHAFTAVTTGRVTVHGPESRGVQLEWDPEVLPWAQLFTSDFDHPDFTRNGLAVEPVSCPPDAFNSGEDVVRLHPGATHRAVWTLQAL